eukprot:CAMPEP_0115170566 /NCGR_PEP_ID=MMETSP0270-20121206/1852_1 /TAXON_ID=71861 /ORGANISM="Scrippsiella trochoidea, Strain CCMP3099" /LENGTH=75 /DNA_ID=CAMNT_0002583303 /DNA_START=1643 /DNA_END=1870 /DNA_ORIENTATION=-
MYPWRRTDRPSWYGAGEGKCFAHAVDVPSFCVQQPQPMPATLIGFRWAWSGCNCAQVRLVLGDDNGEQQQPDAKN